MGCRGAAQDALDLAVAAIDRLDGPRAPDPLAGRSGDALVRDVEHRRNGRIAAVGVGDEQRIRCDDRLQPLLHAVWVEGGQGMAEGLARTVGGDQDRRLRARGRVCGPSRRAGATCGPASAPPCGSRERRSREPRRFRQAGPAPGAPPPESGGASEVPCPAQSRSARQPPGSSRRRQARRQRPASAPCGAGPTALCRSAHRTSSYRPCTGHGEDRAPCPATPPRRRRNADSAARHSRPARSPPARPRPSAGPTAPPPPPCAAPPQLIDTREPIPKPS